MQKQILKKWQTLIKKRNHKVFFRKLIGKNKSSTLLKTEENCILLQIPFEQKLTSIPNSEKCQPKAAGIFRKLAGN